MTGAGHSEAPSVLLADPQPATRSGLRRLLERAGMWICAEAGEADEAIAAALREAPDLCLIDVLLPGSPIETTRAIRVRVPSTTVVIMTASEERTHFLDAIRAGAAGYLLKDMDPDRLPHALYGVLAGEAAIPRPLVAALVSEFQARGRRRLVVGQDGRVDLTAREWEVAEHMVEDMTTADIARRLSISSTTVRRHISQIVRKLGVRDRRAAALILARQGARRSRG